MFFYEKICFFIFLIKKLQFGVEMSDHSLYTNNTLPILRGSLLWVVAV